MTNFLLILSIGLNIVALFCIVILYLRQNRLVEVEKTQEKVMKEMEEVISSYLMEMTEENERFLKKVKGMREITPSSGKASEAPFSADETIEKKEEEKPNLRKGRHFQAVQAYKKQPSIDLKVNEEELLPPLPKKAQPGSVEEPKRNPSPQSDYDQAFILKEEGFSTEEIAKRLNRGKTEIELLLKLRQNEKE